MTPELRTFLFNQGRFVYPTSCAIQKEYSKGKNQRQTFEDIKQTVMGRKYLKNVNFQKVEIEIKQSGSFMASVLEIGRCALKNDYKKSIEDFQETKIVSLL